MPDDDKLTEELITEYDEVRLFFISNPDPRCIPLFLNSFGKGDGFGVYQVVDDVIAMFPASQVVPHLNQALRSANPNTRYWCAEISARFPVPDLIEALESVMQHEDEGTIPSLAAMEHIGTPEALTAMQNFLRNMTNEKLRQRINDIETEIKSSWSR